MVDMQQQTISDFIESLGAKQSTPGGGAAAALSGAQGAALVEMVARFSLGKKASGNATIDWQKVADQMHNHAQSFLALAKSDQEAFAAVMKCYEMPADSPERPAAMETALVGAAEPPLQTIELAWRILGSLEPIVQKANAHVVSDAGIAIEHLRAAIASSEFNVLINAKFMKGKANRQKISDRLESVNTGYRAECDKLHQLTKQRVT